MDNHRNATQTLINLKKPKTGMDILEPRQASSLVEDGSSFQNLQFKIKKTS